MQELSRRVEALEDALSRALASHRSQSEASNDSRRPATATIEQEDCLQGPTPTSLVNRPQSLSESSPAPSIPLHTIDAPLNPSCRQLRDVGRYLGRNWYHRGMPILSDNGHKWIESRTGSDASLGRFELFGSKSVPVSAMSSPQISFQELCRLPDKHLARTILDTFFASTSRFLYPLVDPVLFEETMRRAYDVPDGSPLSHSQVTARTCVLAAIAIMPRLAGSDENSDSSSSPVCPDKAQRLLGYVVGEENLEALQAVLMLVRPPCSSYFFVLFSPFLFCVISGKRLTPRTVPISDIHRSMGERYCVAIRCLSCCLRPQWTLTPTYGTI